MARVPIFKLKYQGKDITADIKPLCTSISVTDKMEGESDEIEIELENSDLRWIDLWLPGEGDMLTVSIGYQGEAMLPETSFEIDEVEFDGAPDRLRLRGLATPVSASLRQKNTVAYENTTLKAIALTIAQKHKLEMVGKVPEIKLERVTQKQQTDLEFLRKLAADYGLIFSIKDTSLLVFYSESDLEEAAAVFAVKRTEISAYRLRRGQKGTYKAATVSYQDPKTGDFIEITLKADGTEVEKAKEKSKDKSGNEPADPNAIASEDTLKIKERVENREQATIKAREALRRANRSKVEGSLDLEGNVKFAAGINLTLTGWKQFDGKYQLASVRHTFNKQGGYKTSAEIKRLDGLKGEE